MTSSHHAEGNVSWKESRQVDARMCVKEGLKGKRMEYYVHPTPGTNRGEISGPHHPSTPISIKKHTREKGTEIGNCGWYLQMGKRSENMILWPVGASVR